MHRGCDCLRQRVRHDTQDEVSGIGLAVCDEIVRLHEGTFDIANAEGGGTVVTIRLPISREEE